MRTLHSKPPIRCESDTNYTGITNFHLRLFCFNRKNSMKNPTPGNLREPVRLSFETSNKYSCNYKRHKNYRIYPGKRGHAERNISSRFFETLRFPCSRIHRIGKASMLIARRTGTRASGGRALRVTFQKCLLHATRRMLYNFGAPAPFRTQPNTGSRHSAIPVHPTGTA
jgi:hypothetical protein